MVNLLKRKSEVLPTQEEMFEIVSRLATVKSNQDVEGALKVYHPEGILEAPPFKTVGRGEQELKDQLTFFFAIFPDYHVTLEGHAFAGPTMVAWGQLHMTLTGEFGGCLPNGKQATLPVFMLFEFKDGRVVRENFNFDLADLCRQSGISAECVIPAN